MEVVEETAFKSSVRPEATAAAKPNNQDSGLSDDLLLGPNNNGAADSDFFVDDLLDFSNASLTDDHPDHHNPEMSGNNNGCATSSSSASKSGVVTLSPEDEFESLPVSGLTVPVDGLESLEWLSHFSEDTDYSLTFPVAKLPPEASKARSESKIVMVDVNKPSSDFTPAQTKARTKRARTGGRVWSLGSPALTESPSSSTSTTTSSCSSPLPWLLFSSFGQMAESLRGRPPAQKSKKKPPAASGDSGLAQQPRRCSHCGVQKTPQWRAGPMGAKTLCNACGVRFKSGRLLPEYRPACSPTFSSELHSNNHRKVMEMRRKKEVETGLLGAPVQSF